MQERKNHLSTLAGSAILFLLLAAAFNLANAAPPAQKVNVVVALEQISRKKTQPVAS